MDKVGSARAYSRKNKVTVVVKGAPSVTATPDGTAYINSTGNPGMASAGMGDVLAGIIGGIWAGGMAAGPAAWTGVYLHGLAGDRAACRLGIRSLMAGDLLREIPEVIVN
jgi:NAD(P)H-hydrate epimerase